MTSTRPPSTRRSRLRLVAVVAAVTAGLSGLVWAAPAEQARAAACSTTAAAQTCSVNTSTTVSTGTLTLTHPPALFWSFVGSGYDQWASGSATSLTACAASAGATTCSGGTAPRLQVTDATGSGNGWSLSAYITGSTLPAGSTLTFNGAGSGTIGTSTAASANPFVATSPGTVCDSGSSCTLPTAAASCSHSSLGYTSCPAYGVNLLAGTSATAQVDVYSAAASSGLGAICFGSGSPTAAGCTGSTSTGFYNLGVLSRAPANTYTGTLNLTVSSGP